MPGDARGVEPVGAEFHTNRHANKGTAAATMPAPGSTVTVKIQIVDSGVGLKGADPDSLFEPFAQGPSASMARAPGTGLGLPIVKEIVTAMGGKCSLREEHRRMPAVFRAARLRMGSQPPAVAANPAVTLASTTAKTAGTPSVAATQPTALSAAATPADVRVTGLQPLVVDAGRLTVATRSPPSAPARRHPVSPLAAPVRLMGLPAAVTVLDRERQATSPSAFSSASSGALGGTARPVTPVSAPASSSRPASSSSRSLMAACSAGDCVPLPGGCCEVPCTVFTLEIPVRVVSAPPTQVLPSPDTIARFQSSMSTTPREQLEAQSPTVELMVTPSGHWLVPFVSPANTATVLGTVGVYPTVSMLGSICGSASTIGLRAARPQWHHQQSPGDGTTRVAAAAAGTRASRGPSRLRTPRSPRTPLPRLARVSEEASTPEQDKQKQQQQQQVPALDYGIRTPAETTPGVDASHAAPLLAPTPVIDPLADADSSVRAPPLHPPAMSAQNPVAAPPVHSGSPTAAVLAPQATQAAAHTQPQLALAGLHVMLVDDDATNRLLGERLLQRAGASCNTASDGAELLATVQRRAGGGGPPAAGAAAEAPPLPAGAGRRAGWNYDALLVDVHLVHTDGDVATAALRASGATDLPIIAVTGTSQRKEVERLLAVGADVVLTKPFTSAQLIAAIVEALRKHASALPV